MPYAKRNCTVCGNFFKPPHRASHGDYQAMHRCNECRGLDTEPVGNGEPLPAPEVIDASKGSDLLPPLVQGVFDLETYTLDRNWGVLLVGSILIHRGGPPEITTYTLRESSGWPHRRGDDGELAEKVAKKLDECHLLIAHNGSRFDIPWMRTLALKHNFAWREKKLVDPCAVAWKRYKLSNNSLQTVANFLGLGQKMPLAESVWRDAILNDDSTAWELLKTRCESDVTILNAIAAKVIGSVNTIDFAGSAWR